MKLWTLRDLRVTLRVLTVACLAFGPLAINCCQQAAGQQSRPPNVTQRQANTTLIPLGTTYSRAQSAAWLDERRFVVGRWDGSLTVFRDMTNESELGPVIMDAMTTPSQQGVEMVASLGAAQFVSSNDAKSLTWWRRTGDGFLPTTLPFSAAYGTAVTALHLEPQGLNMLLVGHQQGYVTFWTLSGIDPVLGHAKPKWTHAVSIRSDQPISWKWQTWHVRRLAPCGPDRIISVAEDGDICLLEVPSGKILARRRYATTAQRGLNDVAVLGDLVAVVNCAVGAGNNLWIYRIEGNSLQRLAGKQLISDKTRDQVFTFSVELFEFNGKPHFVASTEEGLVWLGTIKDNKIVILNQTKVAVEGGVVLALNPKNKTVLAVGHKVQTFAVGPRTIKAETIQP